jgi:hypothetical protein
MGKRWLETVYLGTAVKVSVTKFTGPHAAYFEQYLARQKGVRYFIGMPRDMITGQCKDTFQQVMNSAFPGGLIPVDKAIQEMDTACYHR